MSDTIQVEVPIELEHDCEACVHRLREELFLHHGVIGIDDTSSRSKLRVDIDPVQCSASCLLETSGNTQDGLRDRFAHDELRVTGMDCADCANTIQRAVARAEGVSHAEVSFPASSMRVEYESQSVDRARVTGLVERLGYRVSEMDDDSTDTLPVWKRVETHTFAAAALLLLALFVDFGLDLNTLAVVLYGASILVGGTQIARTGLAALYATRRPDIRFLMTIAVTGAATIGAWLEAALVVVLFSVGELLESRAVEHARRELTGLVALAPNFANLRRSHSHGDGPAHYEESQVPASELKIGDEIVIRPGEAIAADAVLIEGASSVDQAPITGESTPVDKAIGDVLFAGTLNGQGMMVARVSTAPGDSTLARIATLVAEAQSRKSPSERWVDSFARIYTPVVMLASVLVAALPPLLGDTSFADSFYSALALLILACPCALVISTPVAIVSALARASSAGVLIKGGAHLEMAVSISAVAFDKTGTLTEGRPRVVAVDATLGEADELLALAASLEQGSEHPLAKAIVSEAKSRSLQLSPVEGFEALAGLGARGTVDGSEIQIGNTRLFERSDFPDVASIAAMKEFADDPQTRVLLVRDGALLGSIELADTPRPEAAQAISELHKLGIKRTVMLTGDNHRTARAVADGLGIDEVRAELLPADKVAAIAGLGAGTAMVGDGVNDAPALAAADLGIAMGSAGSATAIEVADIALMGDDPRKVAELIATARWTKAVVRQNIAFSLSTKALALAFLAVGALPLWAAVATDVGASLVVVGNSLRLLSRTPGGRLRNTNVLATAVSARTGEFPIAAKNERCCDDC
ncbi:MAG: cation-translocating P-type ATPase [Solirubrobacterales bacterium]|nr:cation-translocating P-type ATPase [Solirubrobacterales bacterium]